MDKLKGVKNNCFLVQGLQTTLFWANVGGEMYPKQSWNVRSIHSVQGSHCGQSSPISSVSACDSSESYGGKNTIDELKILVFTACLGRGVFGVFLQNQLLYV